MLLRLTAEEDAELRWLVKKNMQFALTPNEQRRLAMLRVRDRRAEVRLEGSERPVVIPAQLDSSNGEHGPAYRLSRRFVDLVLSGGGVQVMLLLSTHKNPSYDELVGVMPPELQPKALELLAAIQRLAPT